ncbi:DUF3108 domain-containing protein [Aromatoleum toluolicum]|uniref:DUF3108 domain-containing protein n=1 Tax=Aromatoleum toluolicum TaxID=90060 RepID=A0ABX1NI25_9RHOO|nr:DUF3108 domain-containing protein [Aromatoleum toluolicum]NMF98968.1 DUF3108 domain-containing protein [Aromatoleum toluolicum]
MRQPTILILATGASVLAHALVLSLPGWPAHVGEVPQEPPLLHATLVIPEPKPVVDLAPVVTPPPSPVVPEKPKPRPKPKPKPAPAAEAPPVVPLTAPAGEGGEGGEVALAAPADVATQPAAEAPPAVDAAPVADAAAELVAAADLKGFNITGWPERGSIRFRVHLGEGGFAVGEAQHEWSHDGKRYRMSVAVRTTGVVGMFRSFHYAQSSEGSVGREGLKPERFSVEQSRKTPANAVFDWNARKVTMKRGAKERVADVRPGDQDLLSLWHQIGIVGAVSGSTELNVITGREATPSSVEVVGPEKLPLPIGLLDTVRVRAEARNGSLTIDIWLARNYGMLPVRIRVIDDKGEVLDQQAVELRLSPPGSAGDEAAVAGAGGERAEEDMIELRAEDNAFAHPSIEN